MAKQPIRAYGKTLGASLAILIYFMGGALLTLIPQTHWRRHLQIQWASLIARLLLLIFGVNYRIIGNRDDLSPANLLVSNHLSYVDIMLIAAIRPSVFIAAKDAGRFAPEVILAQCGGNLMINRKNKEKLEDEVAEAASLLTKNFHLVLFPEGTTFDGSFVRRFKIPFFGAAFRSQKNITPICLKYSKINNIDIDEESKKYVFSFEDISLAQHLKRFISLRSIDVDIHILPTLETKEFSDAAQAAEKTFEVISKKFESLGSPSREPHLSQNL